MSQKAAMAARANHARQFKHLAVRGRPIYHKISASKSRSRLKRLIAKAQMMQARRGSKKSA